MDGRSDLDDDHLLHVALDQREAAALVAVLDAVMRQGPLAAGMLAVLGVTADVVALADLAGAKIILRM